MTEQLDVSLYGYRVGTLTRHGVENYVLDYEEDWRTGEGTIPVSLSLPLLRRQHRGRVVAHFLDNLLPDNPDVRQRWATDVGLDTVEPYYLLAHYGEDVAGALSFQPSGSSPTSSRTPMSDSAIAARIAALRDDVTAWHDDRITASGQFSLGGAQTKFSLARHEDGWFQTTGEDASTHIFKPQVTGVPGGELIEFVTMRAAHLLGIPTAQVELFDHDGHHSLVVERFDRRIDAGTTTRLHQEDLVQALGLPRLRKFEASGGPGVDEISRLLTTQADAASLNRYATMLVYSWIVLSTDAHAKNYSVFLDPDGAQLTPLYDASSVIPYLDASIDLDRESLLNRAGDRSLAVRYGASYRVRDVARFELEHIARRCGVSADELLVRTAQLVQGVSSAVAQAAAALPGHLQTDTIAKFVEWMPLRVAQAENAL